MAAEYLSPSQLRDTHPRLRPDRLRVALRGADFDFDAAKSELPDWLTLLDESDDPAFVVLLLELLGPIAGASLLSRLEILRTQRADGVRLMSLRLLCDLQPERVAELCTAHRQDQNLEARVLLATRLHASDRRQSQELLLETLAEEAGGLRERHALERVLGFLVEDAEAHELKDRLLAMREDFHDPEDYFGWALTKLTQLEK